MKPIPIILSPTRSRALNVFLGMVVTLVSILLFLALATYHPTDPSLNTASTGDAAHVRNWIGVTGATLSDILLQAFIIFAPAVLGLLPWHWHWLHAVPVEGVMGRVISGALVVYLNTQGAWLVAAVLALAGIYFASDINFWTLKTQIEDRWLSLVAWHDRYRNWRDERAERKRDLEERLIEQSQPGPAQRLFSGAIPGGPEPLSEAPTPARGSRLAAFFGLKKRVPEPDPVDEIPAFRRAAKSGMEDPAPPRRSSIWERTVAESGVPAKAAAEVSAPAVTSTPVETAPPAPRRRGPPPSRLQGPHRLLHRLQLHIHRLLQRQGVSPSTSAPMPTSARSPWRRRT